MAAAACSRRFSSLGSRSMREARIAWTLAGTWIAWMGAVSRYRPGSPTSAFVSTRVWTLSSRKNGFPSVRSIKRRFSPSSGVATEEGVQELLDIRRCQRINAYLGVVGLPFPSVRVFRAIAQEDQDTGTRQ